MKMKALFGTACAIALLAGLAKAGERPAAEAGAGKLSRRGAQTVPIGQKCDGCAAALSESKKTGEVERCRKKGCGLYLCAREGKPTAKGKCEACVQNQVGGKRGPCPACLKAAQEAAAALAESFGKTVDPSDPQRLFEEAVLKDADLKPPPSDH